MESSTSRRRRSSVALGGDQLVEPHHARRHRRPLARGVSPWSGYGRVVADGLEDHARVIRPAPRTGPRARVARLERRVTGREQPERRRGPGGLRLRGAGPGARGARCVDGTAHAGRAGPHPARDDEPARPGRRGHRHRQDQDAAADGRAAVRPGRAGVPADIKGDLSGHGDARRGQRQDHRRAPAEVGQAVDGARRTRSSSTRSAGRAPASRCAPRSRRSGPTLLAKVLGLNETQESSLGLVFHYADSSGLPLLDLKDLRAVVQYLTSDEGKADLKELGGLSSATAGVILRELIALLGPGRRRVLRRARVRHRRPAARRRRRPRHRHRCSSCRSCRTGPRLFSTFLMWLLADLFHDLPEVGDLDKPKLVFFFDEAHLLFDDASKAFLDAIAADRAADPVQGRRRLLRDPDAQGRARRRARPARQPGAARAARVHPGRRQGAQGDRVDLPRRSDYDLGEVLTQLGIGEAVVTVLSERGAPTPVAWTRLRAPQSLMAPSPAAVLTQVVAVLAAGPEVRRGARPRVGLRAAAGTPRGGARRRPRPRRPRRRPRRRPARAPKEQESVVEQVLGSSAVRSMLRSAGSALGREITRSLFGTARRRR